MFRIIAVCLLTVGYLVGCTFETRKAPEYDPNEKLEKIEATKENVDLTKEAVEKFHKLLNSGATDELFAWIDPKSQLKQDQVAFHVRIGRIRSELGDVERSELQRVAIFKKSGSLEARAEYITRFTKDKDSRPRYELFYLDLDPDGSVQLLEYKNGIDNEKGY